MHNTLQWSVAQHSFIIMPLSKLCSLQLTVDIYISFCNLNRNMLEFIHKQLNTTISRNLWMSFNLFITKVSHDNLLLSSPSIMSSRSKSYSFYNNIPLWKLLSFRASHQTLLQLFSIGALASAPAEAEGLRLGWGTRKHTKKGWFFLDQMRFVPVSKKKGLFLNFIRVHLGVIFQIPLFHKMYTPPPKKSCFYEG